MTKKTKLVTIEEMEKIIEKFNDKERGFVSTFPKDSRRKLLYTLLIEGQKDITANMIGKVRKGYKLTDKLRERLIINNFSGVVVDEAVQELEKQGIIKIK